MSERSFMRALLLSLSVLPSKILYIQAIDLLLTFVHTGPNGTTSLRKPKLLWLVIGLRLSIEDSMIEFLPWYVFQLSI